MKTIFLSAFVYFRQLSGRNHGSTTTHLLCELRCQSTGGDTPRVSCNVIDSYSGGQKHTMLTRNSLLVIPPSSQESTDERVLVCVGDETLSKVNVSWCFSTLYVVY